MEAMKAERFSAPLKAAQPASKPERGKKRKQLSDASEPKRSKKNDKLALASSRDDSVMESKSADLLTKSMKRSELNALAAKGEIHLVSGPFTQEERNLVGKLVEDYMQRHSMSLTAFQSVIFGRGKMTDFWKTITPQIPGRPLEAVRNHVQRRYRLNARKGPWSPEEDRELIAAQAQHGNDWKLISTIVDRLPDDCRDRWKTQLKLGQARKTGPWTDEEIRKLLRAIRDVCEIQEQSLDDADGILWSAVSHKMGATRSSKQCRNKWVDDLIHLHRARIESRQPWTPAHGLTLARGVAEAAPKFWKDVPWKEILKDPALAVYSPHRLRNIFRHYVSSVEPNWRNLDFRAVTRKTLLAVEDWAMRSKKLPGLSEAMLLSEEFISDSEEDTEEMPSTPKAPSPQANIADPSEGAKAVARNASRTSRKWASLGTIGRTIQVPEGDDPVSSELGPSATQQGQPTSTQLSSSASSAPLPRNSSASARSTTSRLSSQAPSMPMPRDASASARQRSRVATPKSKAPSMPLPRDASASARQQLQAVASVSIPPAPATPAADDRKPTKAERAEARAQKAARKQAKAARKAERAARREAKAARKAVENLV